MKTLTLICGVTALLVSGMATAQHSKDKELQMPAHKKMMSKTDKHSMMMKGLTPSEKKIAMKHMANMTPDEHAVMMKRSDMCMKDGHKGMKGMKMTEKTKMDHMTNGLTKSEQKTMKRMWTMMSPQEKKVGEKMMMNCCKAGMKHHM